MLRPNTPRTSGAWLADKMKRFRFRRASIRERALSVRPAVECLEPRHLLAAGNVFLTGHDVLLHGGFNNFDSKILDFMRGAGTPAEIAANEYSIAVLGSGRGHWEFSNGGQVKDDYARTSYFNTNDLERLPGRWAEVLGHDGLIVLSHESCGGCDISDQGIREINDNRDAILLAIDMGMDLWMSSSGESVGYYDVLDPITNVVSVNGHFDGSYEFTAEGRSLGFDDSINFVNHHNVFEPNEALTVVSEVVGADGESNVVSAYLGRVKVDGHVWHDENRNGVRDAGETPIAGVAVSLSDNSGIVSVTESDSSGRYSLFGPRPGTFHVTVLTPTGTALSPVDAGDDRIDSDINPGNHRSDDFPLDYNAVDQTIDIGLFGSDGLAKIKSNVWNDQNANGIQDVGEPPLENVNVDLLDADGKVVASMLSGEDGRFQFADLVPGNYQLRFDPGLDYALTPQYVGFDRLIDTDADPDSGLTHSFTLLPGQMETIRDAGVVRVYAVNGRVWRDANGDGIEDFSIEAEPGVVGVRMELHDRAGQVVDSTTSDDSGNYQLRAVPGHYFVAVHPVGTFQLSPADQGLDPGRDSDFGPETKRSHEFEIVASSLNDLDAGLAPAEFAITEFMAINQSGIMDQTGRFSDWIEITNVGSVAADLKGWYLTDRADRLTKFQFPGSRILQPDESVVAFANNGGQIDPEIHVDFRLSGSGEYLALVAPDGVTKATEFSPTYGQQVPNVSYGQNESGEGVFFTVPTPGTPNGEGLATVPFSLLITEVMAINHGTLVDEDGDFADWIEIHNAGETSVPLKGWALSDDGDFGDGWKFPERTLDPGEYLVVFASANDRSSKDGELHTDFKISGDYSETISLVDPDGVTVVSEFELFDQQSDISYGLSSDFRTQRFFSTPTPGAPNTEQFLTVAFSHLHGYYNQAIELELSTETAGAEVRYTTDGSEPSPESMLYTNPLTVDETSIFRASAFLAGEQGAPTTRSFLFVDDVVRQDGLGQPSTWGFVSDYEMDPDIVDDPIFAERVKNAFAELPTVSIVAEEFDLFSITDGIYSNPMFVGGAWTRNASFELIDHQGGPGLQLDVGLSIDHSVGEVGPPESPKLPLRVEFDPAYGSTSTDVAIFSEDRGVDALVLHAGYEDAWIHKDGMLRERAQYTRDAWYRDTQKAMGQPSLESAFAHLYINGQYWGVYNTIEAPTAHVIAGHLGGTAAEYDVINGAGVVAGESKAWTAMLEVANGDLYDGNQYDLIRRHLDVENLADFILLDRYADNAADSLDGWYAVRRRAGNDRFRFLAWDSEKIFSAETDPLVTVAGTPRYLFDRLMTNQEFRQLFADRLQTHLFNDGALDPDQVAQRFEQYQLEVALVAESARWGDYRRDAHDFETGPYSLKDGRYAVA